MGSGKDGTLYITTDLWLQSQRRVSLLERRARDRELELAREQVERQQSGPPRKSLHFSSDYLSGEFCFSIN